MRRRSMSSKKQLLLVLSLLVVGGVLLSACGGATPVPEEAAAPAEQEPIIIGAVFDRTGWMAAYDDPPRSAAFLAGKVLNERGGILGRPGALIEIDGKTDPALGGTAARQT